MEGILTHPGTSQTTGKALTDVPLKWNEGAAGDYRSLEEIPDEVKVQILSYLPVPDLCQVALVSSSWCELARDHALWRRLEPLSHTTDDVLYYLIEKYPNITHFKYNKSCITEQGLSRMCVQCGDTLTHLNLGSCDEVTNDLLAVIAQFCVMLTHIDISANPSIDDMAMIQLSYCRSLVSLRVANCDRVTDGGLEILLQMRQLKELDTSYLLEVRLRTLENLIKHCAKTITSLWLDGGNLTDEDVVKLVNLPNLRFLEIQYCDELFDTGISTLSQLTNLDTLKLARCFNLTSSCVDVLVSGLRLLRVLVLSDCTELDDRCLVMIGRHCGALQHLELTQSYCHAFTDIGISAVILGCSTLQSLVLRGIKGIRTFPTLIPVARPRNLRLLSLGGCQNIDPALLEIVAAFCPSLTLIGHYGLVVKPCKMVLQALHEGA